MFVERPGSLSLMIAVIAVIAVLVLPWLVKLVREQHAAVG